MPKKKRTKGDRFQTIEMDQSEEKPKPTKLKIFEAAYKRTVNLGNYESQSLELRCQIGEDENVDAAIISLVAKVKLELEEAE